MKNELTKTGLSEDDILHKSMTLMKAFCKEDQNASLAELSLTSKQANSALKRMGVSPKEFAKVSDTKSISRSRSSIHKIS